MHATLISLDLFDPQELNVLLDNVLEEPTPIPNSPLPLNQEVGNKRITGTFPIKQPATKKRKKSSVDIKKLLKLLTKEQLQEVISKAIVDFPVLEETIRTRIPPYEISTTIQEAQKLKASIFKSFPHTRYGSSYDHYCYTHVRPAQNTFISFVSKPLKLLSDAKQWRPLLDYILVAIEETAELPNWDSPADRQPKENLFKKFAAHLQKVLTQNDMTLQRHDCERISAVCTLHNTIENGLPFTECLKTIPLPGGGQQVIVHN